MQENCGIDDNYNSPVNCVLIYWGRCGVTSIPSAKITIPQYRIIKYYNGRAGWKFCGVNAGPQYCIHLE